MPLQTRESPSALNLAQRLALLIAWLFALLLIASALAKWANMPGFGQVVASYQVLPQFLLMPSAWALSVFEALLGLRLLLACLQRLVVRYSVRSGHKPHKHHHLVGNASLSWVFPALVLLHLMYFAWLSLALYRGLDIPNCGCFGVYWPRPLTLYTLIEDAMLIVLAAWLWRHAAVLWPTPASIPAKGPSKPLASLMLVVCLHLVWASSLTLGTLPKAIAAQVGDTQLPDELVLGPHSLVLNGAGIREYGVFRVAVYAAGLYLPQKESQADKILSRDGPWAVQMKLFRSASKEDSIKAWRVYLEANCKAGCTMEAISLERFLGLVPETKAGDTQTLQFEAGRLSWTRNGQRLGELESVGFARLVLATWIGAAPSTQALKKALLGNP